MREGSLRGDWAMCVDVPNPAFQQAIHNGMVIIDSLPKVVIFGVPGRSSGRSPGCVPGVPFGDAPGRMGSVLRALSGCDLELPLVLHLHSYAARSILLNGILLALANLAKLLLSFTNFY